MMICNLLVVVYIVFQVWTYFRFLCTCRTFGHSPLALQSWAFTSELNVAFKGLGDLIIFLQGPSIHWILALDLWSCFLFLANTCVLSRSALEVQLS
jgi:hypothetical protein